MPALSYRDELRRKLVHLSSLWMPAVMCIFSSWRYSLALFFFLLTLGSVLVEHAYARKNPTVRKLYNVFFKDMLRKEPGEKDWIISGGPPVLAASCLSLLLFPPFLAAASMAVMLLGDTAAALVGKRWGRVRFSNGKSLEGSIAFVIAGTVGFSVFYSFCAGVSLHLLGVALTVSILCSAVEFFQSKIRLDDNLMIPVCAGFTAWLLL